MLPDQFLLQMQQLLGEEYPAFLKSYEIPAKHALRLNPLKVSPDTFENIAPFHLTKVPWIDGAYFYEEEDAPARHPFYAAGLYYLQEPSAMTPAAVLAAQPGERVLDVCAAPGGKATALGACLQGEGLLVANDISAARCKALVKNLELFGIENAFVTNAVPAKLQKQFPEYFDRVLLDAPCSGEGMFRKDEATIRAWYPEKVTECAAIQKDLILQAADMLRPGGRLLYSTCTFAPEENEEVIAHLLARRPKMHLLQIPPREGFSPGLDGLTQCVRLWPHKIQGEGHFLALLEKEACGTSGDVSGFRTWEDRKEQISDQGIAMQIMERVQKTKKYGKRGKQKGCKEQGTIPGRRYGKMTEKEAFGEQKQREIVARFFDEISFHGARRETWLSQMQLRGSYVYFDTAYSGTLPGIPFLRNGLFAGELKKDRFEPSQELAMALSARECMHLSLPAEDERIRKYLRGETILITAEDLLAEENKWDPSRIHIGFDCSGSDNEHDLSCAAREMRLSESDQGWVLLCVEGYPLGWGKKSGMLFKNKYHPGWRKNA